MEVDLALLADAEACVARLGPRSREELTCLLRELGQALQALENEPLGV